MQITAADKAGEPPLHVAVAVVLDTAGRVLVALREKHRHQGGKWEFPGGKVELGESAREALVREIHEEVGLTIESCHPLRKLSFSYPDRTVTLDIWAVRHFTGEARGCEGQQIRWLFPSELDRHEFPAANATIVRALQLPNTLSITPRVTTLPELRHLLQSYHQDGVEFIWLREQQVDSQLAEQFALQAQDFCSSAGITLILSLPNKQSQDHSGLNFHASSTQLRTLRSRPNAPSALFSASCHDAQELQLARELGADFALLFPPEHPASASATAPLDYQHFKRLADTVYLPVYAGGQLGSEGLQKVLGSGGWGIANIKHTDSRAMKTL